MKEEQDLEDRIQSIQAYAQGVGMSAALGIVFIAGLVNHGLAKRPSDLYALTKEMLMADGFVNAKLAERYLEVIDHYRHTTLANVLLGYRIPGVGLHTATIIKQVAGDIAGLATVTSEELVRKGVPTKCAKAFTHWIRDPKNLDELRALSIHLILE